MDPAQGLQILNTPQPAAPQPSVIPNAQPSLDDLYKQSQDSAPAPTSAGAGSPSLDDLYKQSQGGGGASTTTPSPQQHSFDTIPDNEGLPGSIPASASDLSKVNSTDNPQQQLQILKSLHPQSKPMLEGNVLTYEHNGVRIPFDGKSLDVVKDLAQWSGQGVNFVTQGITQMGATVAGSLLGPWGSVVGYEAGLPASAYLGTTAQDFLKQKWAKLPPDPAQFKEDVEHAMRFNIIAGNVLPAAAAGLGYAQMRMFAQGNAPKVLENAIKGTLEAINGKPLDIRSGGIAGGETSLTPESDVGNRVLGFFDKLHKNISGQIEKYVGQSIADSKGQTVNLGKGSLATFNRVLREGSSGPNPAISMDPSGYAVSMPGASVDLSTGGSIHMGATEPFGVSGQGKQFSDMIARDYNTVLAAHKTPGIGGVNLQYLNEMTQKYQKIAFGDLLPPGINPGEGVGLDPKLRAQASQIAHQLSEDRLMGMQKYLSDPDAKNSVEGVYRNYSQKIDPIKQFLSMAKQNQMNPTSIVNSLFTENNAPYVKMLKDITSDGVHEGVFNDLRSAWTNKAVNNSINPDGTFNASQFRQEIKNVGNDNMTTMFSSRENMQLRADTQLLQRFQSVKPSDTSSTNALARLVTAATPLKTMGRFAVGSGSNKLLNMLKSKPSILDAIAGEGMDNVIANSSLKDMPQAVKLKSFLKNFAMSKPGTLTQANQAVHAAAQPYEKPGGSAQPQSLDDLYQQSMSGKP